MRVFSLCVAYAALAMLISFNGAHAKGYKVLYSFCAQQNCADGAMPVAGLILDKAGNLYGTTCGEESDGAGCGASGCGSVFMLSRKGSETTLYNFGGSGGCNPEANLMRDKAGNLYGTTTHGGANGGNGTVFMLAPDNSETVLHSFSGTDGARAYGGLVKDSAGNFYGTTEFGGANDDGAIFKLAPDGTETVLYSFCSQPNCSDGSEPASTLIRDKAGNLYGTTRSGGSNFFGTVFKLPPGGIETVLYNFCSQSNCADGEQPFAGLIRDSAGNFYGTTVSGGNHYGGTAFKLAPDGTETVLYSFTGQNGDGQEPYGELTRDKAGNFYGTTARGGTGCTNVSGCGTVFKLASDGTETVLHAFDGGSDGATPADSLVLDEHTGVLYGTTEAGGGTGCGGYGCGTVFKLAK